MRIGTKISRSRWHPRLAQAVEEPFPIFRAGKGAIEAFVADARREAFVPTLFAYAGQQPIALRPSYAALADAAPPQLFWAGLTDGDIAQMTQLLPALQRYDYVAFAGGGPVDVPPNRCLARFYRQPSFQIFAVLHDPVATAPRGNRYRVAHGQKLSGGGIASMPVRERATESRFTACTSLLTSPATSDRLQSGRARRTHG